VSFLSIEGLTKRFGTMVAVDAVTLEVPRDGILSIIGPNGAGKTTFFNLLTGFYRPDGGRLKLKDRDITGLPPHENVKAGVAKAFQIASLFPEMTVLDNVRIGVQSHLGAKRHLFARFEDNAHVREEALRILELFGLQDFRHRPVGALSHGDRKVLDLAMALTARPELLLLDEPAAGLSVAEQARMTELIGEHLRKQAKLIIVEHDMDMVFGLSDHIMVLSQGKKLAYGTPREIAANEAVQAAYLGGDRSHA
jgi:branched-chain amino acid transport system ATP-binding protein